MGQVVNTHATAIKNIETQLSWMLAKINGRYNGTLPNDTITNQKLERGNMSQCMDVTTHNNHLSKDYVVMIEETLEEAVNI